MLWIVKYLTGAWGRGARWEADSAEHPHEDNYLKLDCSKAKSLLGWSPKLDLAATLEWIVEWYQGFERNEDMRALTEQQIVRFENLEAA